VIRQLPSGCGQASIVACSGRPPTVTGTVVVWHAGAVAAAAPDWTFAGVPAAGGVTGAQAAPVKTMARIAIGRMLASAADMVRPAAFCEGAAAPV
jgi:hypothetical protein